MLHNTAIIKILIIGPISGVGGVRTHVEQLVKLFGSYKFKVTVTKAHPFEVVRNFFRFKPHVVVDNLSVYPKHLFKNIVGRLLMLGSSTKHILHIHGGHFTELSFFSNPKLKRLLSLHFHRYDRIFCLTEDQYTSILELSFTSRKKSSIQKIFNYVDIPEMKKQPKINGILNLLFLSRLVPEKGVLDAIAAVNLIDSDDLRLWIVGHGDLEPEISKIKDPRIKYVGKKIGKEKYKYFAMADVFIFPSSWPEGMPYAMLEASAHGLALIGTNVGAVDQILFDGVNGFFIKAGDVDLIADVIKKFLKNPLLVNQMGNESYNICKKYFSSDHLKKIYADLFVEWKKDKSHENLTFDSSLSN